MAGVYDNIEGGEDSENLHENFGSRGIDGSLLGKITALQDQMATYLNAIYNGVQKLNAVGHPQEAALTQQYEAALREYKPILDFVTTSQGRNVPPSEVQDAMSDLTDLCRATANLANKIQAATNGSTMVGGMGQVPDDLGPASDDTSMTVPASDDVITLQEAGPIAEWWDGLSDSTRLLIKAGAIGLGLFVGKKALGFATRKWHEMEMKHGARNYDDDEPEIDHGGLIRNALDDDDDDDDYEDPRQ